MLYIKGLLFLTAKRRTLNKYIFLQICPIFTMYFAVKRSDEKALRTGPGLRLRDPAPQRFATAVLLLFVILPVLRLHAYLFYLGLNDRAVERGYTWSDGSPVTFINWLSGEPSNNFYENCIEMFQNGFQWNDLRCIEARGYICKQPLGKKRPKFLLRVPLFCLFFCFFLGGGEQLWRNGESTRLPPM